MGCRGKVCKLDTNHWMLSGVVFRLLLPSCCNLHPLSFLQAVVGKRRRTDLIDQENAPANKKAKGSVSTPRKTRTALAELKVSQSRQRAAVHTLENFEIRCSYTLCSIFRKILPKSLCHTEKWRRKRQPTRRVFFRGLTNSKFVTNRRAKDKGIIFEKGRKSLTALARGRQAMDRNDRTSVRNLK